MEIIKELEQLKREWKAAEDKALAEKHSRLSEAYSFKIKGLEAALDRIKRPSNTQMQIDALKCGVCGKNTDLVCTDCAKNYIGAGHD